MGRGTGVLVSGRLIYSAGSSCSGIASCNSWIGVLAASTWRARNSGYEGAVVGDAVAGAGGSLGGVVGGLGWIAVDCGCEVRRRRRQRM